MNEHFSSRLRVLVLAPCLLALAACGDDSGEGDDGGAGEDGGSSSASQEVQDLCDPVSRIMADSLSAQDCGDNYRLFQTGCERKGTEAEDAGCAAEFRTEQTCLAETLTAESCSCGDGGNTFSCSLPCLDQVFAREQCVDGE